MLEGEELSALINGFRSLCTKVAYIHENEDQAEMLIKALSNKKYAQIVIFLKEKVLVLHLYDVISSIQ